MEHDIDVIVISSDDEGAPNPVPPPIPQMPTAPQFAVPKRPRVPPRSTPLPTPAPVEDDDEIQFVSHVTKKSRSTNPDVNTSTTTPPANNPNKTEFTPVYTAPTAGADEDDEIIVVGKKTGVQANVDYPHNRFSCGVYPFGSFDKRTFCDKCYCYVCDDVASKCTQWNYHCAAIDKINKWRSERAKASRARNARKPITPYFKRRTSRDFFTSRRRNTPAQRQNPFSRNSLSSYANNTSARRNVLEMNSTDAIPPSSFAASLPSVVSFQDNVLAILNCNRAQIDTTGLSQSRLPPINSSTANALEALDSALSLQWPRPPPRRSVSSALMQTPIAPRPQPRSAPPPPPRHSNIPAPPLSAPPTNGIPRHPFEVDPNNSSDGVSYEEVRRLLNNTPISAPVSNRRTAARTIAAPSTGRTARTWTAPLDVDNSPNKLPPLVSPREIANLSSNQVVLPPVPAPVPAPPPLPTATSNEVHLPSLVSVEPAQAPNNAINSNQEKSVTETVQDLTIEPSPSIAKNNNLAISSLVQPLNSNNFEATSLAAAPVQIGATRTEYPEPPRLPPSTRAAANENEGHNVPNAIPSPFEMEEPTITEDYESLFVSERPSEMPLPPIANEAAQPMQGVSKPEQQQAANMRRRDPTSPDSSTQSRESTPAAAESMRRRAQEAAVMDPLRGLVNMGLDNETLGMGDLANVLNKDGDK